MFPIVEAVDDSGFTDQEKAFIQYYSESLNKTRAYIQAFDYKGESQNATNRATTLLKDPKIHSEVSKRLQSGLDLDVSKSPSLLLKYIEAYLQLDISDYYEDNGDIIPLSELQPEVRMLVSNVTKQINNKTGGVELTYNLPDKAKLLDKLSDLVKFVAQVRAFSGDVGDESSEAARKRDEVFSMNVEETSLEPAIEPVVKKRRVVSEEQKAKIGEQMKKRWAERKAKENLDNGERQ